MNSASGRKLLRTCGTGSTGWPSHRGRRPANYLISAATDRCNAKIRNALMDIKIMIGTHRGLEQWKPVLKAGFPP